MLWRRWSLIHPCTSGSAMRACFLSLGEDVVRSGVFAAARFIAGGRPSLGHKPFFGNGNTGP